MYNSKNLGDNTMQLATLGGLKGGCSSCGGGRLGALDITQMLMTYLATGALPTDQILADFKQICPDTSFNANDVMSAVKAEIAAGNTTNYQTILTNTAAKVCVKPAEKPVDPPPAPGPGVTPPAAETDYTLLYVLGGIIVVGGLLYYYS